MSNIKLPRVVAFYHSNMNPWNMRMHCHDRMELMYVHTGKAVVEMENCQISMEKSDCILIKAMTYHALLVEGPGTVEMSNVEFTQFSPEDIDCLAQQLDLRGYVLARDAHHLLDIAIRSVIDAMMDSERVQAAPLIASLSTLEVIELVCQLGLKPRQRRATKKDDCVKRLQNLLQTDYGEEMSIDAMARKLDINKAYLCKSFRQATGQTIGQALTDIRLENARRLLESTNESILCVCTACGFNSQQYFVRIFRKAMQCTPREYRLRMRKLPRDNGELIKKEDYP